MIYPNIAEYEEGDSILAKQTILDLHKEIERLQKENNKLKFKPKTQFRDVIDLRDESKRLHSIIKEAKDYIRSKSIKFTMAYVEDDGRIDLSRSDYRIDKLTSKQVKELLEILDKEK